MGQWSAFYNTARWQRLRKQQLLEHPLCAFCLQRGQVIPATVADHVEPHKGDWTAFCTGKLQSLCELCHNGRKREIELRGYCTDVDSMAIRSIPITRSIVRGERSASPGENPRGRFRGRLVSE